jgi:inosine-uridine nucleoside N-ribohydrolase
MRQVIMEPGRPVTLIATGPLTNVAALMLAPTPGAPPSSTCTR